MKRGLFVLSGISFSFLLYSSCTKQQIPVKTVEANNPSVVNMKPSDESTLFFSVEEPPVFPGGFEEMHRFIAKNTRYPEEARKNGEQGKVAVIFNINRDGSISDAQIGKGISESLNREALRVVNLMPSWIPAKHNDKVVKFQQVVYIPFSI